jgi:plasmid stabilization system protein ParE
MSYKLVHRPAVKTDILHAIDYYKNINPQVAQQFLSRLREAKEYIAKSPLGFGVKYKSVRTLLLKQFPYHVHYIIDETNQRIVILAIIHSYKNPNDFTNR